MKNTYIRSLLYLVASLLIVMLLSEGGDREAFIFGGSAGVYFLAFLMVNFERKFEDSWKESLLLTALILGYFTDVHSFILTLLFVGSIFFLKIETEKIFIAGALLLTISYVGGNYYKLEDIEGDLNNLEFQTEYIINELNTRVEVLEENY